MDYKVIFTENALEDMDSIVEYLLFHLRNKQAACHFIDSVENGKFVWPRNKDEVMKITDQQFRWLLEGLKIEQPRTIKKSNKRCAI